MNGGPRAIPPWGDQDAERGSAPRTPSSVKLEDNLRLLT